MGTSLDDLIALIKQRGTPDRFPERDELHALLDPFRSVPDQESLRLALAATVRKGDRLVARVGAEALAYLGGEAALGPLVGIAMDESLGTSQRAAVVWALDRHLPDVRARLAPDEQAVFMSLPVFEILEDPEADHGFGLQALLSSYAGLSPAVRTSFLAAIAQAAGERGVRMAGLCMHLLTVETDPTRRRELLDRAAADVTQEAADLLATFAAKAEDAAEAKHARRHVHLLRGKGLRGVVQADLDGPRALVTGVDGDACFAVNLIVPRLPVFDFVNLLFHVETGLRDGFVIHNLPSRDVDEVVQKIKRGCGSFCGFVPMPLAARIVDEVKGGSRAAAIDNGDAMKAMAMAELALAEARQEPWQDPPPPADVQATPEAVSRLLDSAGFESWFFETGEMAVRKAVAALRKPVAGKGRGRAQALAERMKSASVALASALQADGEHLRLQRMLRHQARLLDCIADPIRAGLCRMLAAEVIQPGSIFLGGMAARALQAALEEDPRDDRAARFVEARQNVRGLLGQVGTGHAKANVAELDLSAVAQVELVMRNRQAPSSRRAPLVAIEMAALKVGRAFVEAGEGGDQRAEIEAAALDVLRTYELFGAKQRKQIAAELVAAMTEFRQAICRAHCPHRCFDDPAGDGRAPFYAEGLPWQGQPPVPELGTRRGSPGE